jgi:hypothetical protein
MKKSNGWVQLVNSEEFINHHPFKFRILTYGGIYSIGFGIITRNRRMSQYSGDTEHS